MVQIVSYKPPTLLGTGAATLS